jgi:hypothetical protein
METWATAAPLLCAVHCLATPLVVALAPRLAGSEEHERAAVGASLVLAVLTTALGMRAHGRGSPLALVGAGALLWAATLLALPVPEEAATLGATLLMAGGALRGARLRHRAACARCGCPAGAVEDGMTCGPSRLPDGEGAAA